MSADAACTPPHSLPSCKSVVKLAPTNARSSPKAWRALRSRPMARRAPCGEGAHGEDEPRPGVSHVTWEPSFDLPTKLGSIHPPHNRIHPIRPPDNHPTNWLPRPERLNYHVCYLKYPLRICLAKYFLLLLLLASIIWGA